MLGPHCAQVADMSTEAGGNRTTSQDHRASKWQHPVHAERWLQGPAWRVVVLQKEAQSRGLRQDGGGSGGSAAPESRGRPGGGPRSVPDTPSSGPRGRRPGRGLSASVHGRLCHTFTLMGQSSGHGGTRKI